MKKKNLGKNLNRPQQNGFTIVEMLVSLGVLVIAFTLWSGSLTQVLNLSEQGKDKFNLAMEQRALISLLEAVSKNTALQALCVSPSGKPIPHPYGKLQADGTCEVLKEPMDDEVAKWQDLAHAVSRWGAVSLGADLDPVYFEQEISPKMAAAGCLHCHSGSTKNYQLPAGFSAKLGSDRMNVLRPDLAARDFGVASDLTQFKTYEYQGAQEVSEPLVSKAVLTSSFGQTMLTKQITLSQVLTGSSRVEHYVTFERRDVPYTIANYDKLAHSAPGLCSAVNAATACNASSGEIYDSNSCQEFCTAYDSPPVCSCGKGCFQICPGWSPTCQNWEAQYLCLTKEKVELKTAYDVAGGLSKVAPFNPPSWEVLPDNVCALSLPIGPQCGGIICGVGTGDTCLESGSCRHFCTNQSWSAPYSCGKGCYSPPVPNGCLKKKVEYKCHLAAAKGTTSVPMVYFSVNSILFDASGSSHKSLTAVGSVR